MTNPLKENFIDSPEMVELIESMLNAKAMEIAPSVLKKSGRLKKRPKKDNPKWMNDFHSGLLRLTRPSSKDIPIIANVEEFLEIAKINWEKFDQRLRAVALPKSKWEDLEKLIKLKYQDINNWASGTENSQLGTILFYLSAVFSPWLFFHREGVELRSEERTRLTACSDMLEKLEAFGILGEKNSTWRELWSRVQAKLEIEISGLATASDYTPLEPLLSWIVDYCDECGYDQSTKVVMELVEYFKRPNSTFPGTGLRGSLERYLSIRRSFLKKTRLVESEYGLMFEDDVKLLKELKEYEDGSRTGPHPFQKFTNRDSTKKQ